MIDRIRRFIQKEKLLPQNAKIVVGLSGGIDSMALLDLLTLLGYRCMASHCNFHLRGEESDRDAAFVKKWCKSIDIPFTSIDFDTNQYATDRKISIEMAARELRYNWFEITRKQYEADAVAVAHQKDDSVETVLLNLIRGTGIKGLTGISPKNGTVVRPLLCVTRAEIEQYIIERDLPYVSDSTNEQDIYLRNALRLHIIPQMEELNPALKESIYHTSQHLSEAEKVYSGSIRASIEKVYQQGRIDVVKLRETISPKSVLFELLSPLGFGPSTVEDIFQSMDATPGKVFYSEQYRLIKDRDCFLVDPVADEKVVPHSIVIAEGTQEILSPVHLLIETKTMPVDIVKSRCFLYVDADRVKYPLALRKWQAGDWFIPFGMSGKKKLSDYFTDRKFSLKDKEDAWLLVSGDDIVWIVGERPDDRFKITDKSVNVLFISSCSDRTILTE